MKINSYKTDGKFSLPAFGLLLLLLAICPHRAEAQTNTFPASGNAGVGTTSPGAKVHIAVDNYESVWFDRSANTGSPTLFSMGITYDTPGNEYFRIGHRSGGVGLHDFVLSKTGNVGIGTTSPSQKLQVIGQAGFFNSATGISINGGLSAGVADLYSDYLSGSEPKLHLATFSKKATASGITIDTSGNVGIGITNPTVALDIQGSINVSGNINAKYQDVAEWVESSQSLPAGTVVVLDHTTSNQVIASSHAYDTRVAGVISAQPGITLGEKGERKVLVATTGRVKVRVDASSGPIQVGDLLVTSDIAGVAKKSKPLLLGGVPIHRPGTLIGKALEPLAKGRGEILVLLSLQ
jgi:hypothetical protein